MKIILGSQSKGRRMVLREMGYEFETLAADIDEKSIRADNPEKLTLALASAKAAALLPRLKEEAVLITSDQVAVCGGRILEKPKNEEEFRSFVRLYNAGYPSETVTAVVITDTATGRQKSGVDIAKIILRPLPEKIISELIREGNVFFNSGGLDIDDPLIRPFIAQIEGERESVIGLPKKLTERLIENISRKDKM